jgi:hypothetical protein
MAKKDYSKLLYKKQFFYGPEKASYQGWKFYRMPDKQWLSAHSDLNVVQISKKDFEVTLLGFVLDPERPEAKDADILHRLCETATSLDGFIQATEPLGGRWIIFLTQKDQSIVFNDAAGTRTIFYYQDQKEKFWLGTQSGLLAEKFGFVESEESKEYRASARFQHRLEAWWPGACSPFAEVKQLLPNHLLNLTSGKVQRFWPNRNLERIDLDTGVRKAAAILKGVIASAHQRYPLIMSLSSGVDSRTVFSACKDYVKDMQVFSLKYRKLTDESADVRVPREIAKDLGFKYKVLDCKLYQSENYKKVFDHNVVGIKTDWSPIAECRTNELPEKAVVIKGTISEIMKRRYWSVGAYPLEITLDLIVGLMALGKSKIVVDHLNEWLKDATPSQKFGYKLLDLLSWEIEVGNWYSLGHAVFDIAQEDFTPFNNRKFFNTMLSIHPKYRNYYTHIAQNRIVELLWPELAQYPYSPGADIPRKKPFDLIIQVLRFIKRRLFGNSKRDIASTV